MSYLGWFLAICGIAALIGALLQRRKMGTIAATPFKKTGEASTATGEISCEGAVRSNQPLTAPCSGRPCIYYEVEVKQKWEKQVATENGMQKKTGTNTAHKAQAGSTFQLDDGSGPVNVDVQKDIDGQLESSFSGKGAGSGYLTFGQFEVKIGASGEGHATGTVCEEKIIPADGNLFVLGKNEGGTIRKRDGMLGKLMLSTKGRDALLGSAKRNMMIGFVAAGLLFPVGTGIGIFGPAPAPGAPSCDAATLENSLAEACNGRLHGHNDVVVHWHVTEGGTYRFNSVGTGTDQQMRLWPSLDVINDATGEHVFQASGPGGDPINEVSGVIEPGDYTIRVNDVSNGYAAGLEGGAGFSLDIDLETPAGGDEAATDETETAETDSADSAEGETDEVAEAAE